MTNNKSLKELENQLDLARDRYRWALEDASKWDNEIDSLKKQIAEFKQISNSQG